MQNLIARLLMLLMGVVTVVNASFYTADANATFAAQNRQQHVYLTVGQHRFTVRLEDNATAQALLKQLPITIRMSEFNGQEKYYDLAEPLPTRAIDVERITAGDLMLFGDRCIVLFYSSFNTVYKYTKIGHIVNVAELAAALGTSSITVTITQ